jgi:hypothetical protein
MTAPNTPTLAEVLAAIELKRAHAGGNYHTWVHYSRKAFEMVEAYFGAHRPALERFELERAVRRIFGKHRSDWSTVPVNVVSGALEPRVLMIGDLTVIEVGIDWKPGVNNGR